MCGVRAQPIGKKTTCITCNPIFSLFQTLLHATAVASFPAALGTAGRVGWQKKGGRRGVAEMSRENWARVKKQILFNAFRKFTSTAVFIRVSIGGDVRHYACDLNKEMTREEGEHESNNKGGRRVRSIEKTQKG